MKRLVHTSIFVAILAAASTSYSQVAQEWVQIYNGPGNGLDIAFSIVVDNLGNVYVAGNSPGTTSANDITTIKYNSAGQQQWVQRYNGPGNSDDGTNGTNAIAVDNSGNVYVAGWSAGEQNTDYVVINTTATVTNNGRSGITDLEMVTTHRMGLPWIVPAMSMLQATAPVMEQGSTTRRSNTTLTECSNGCKAIMALETVMTRHSHLL